MPCALENGDVKPSPTTTLKRNQRRASLGGGAKIIQPAGKSGRSREKIAKDRRRRRLSVGGQRFDELLEPGLPSPIAKTATRAVHNGNVPDALAGALKASYRVASTNRR